ncbi:MAG: aminotransferase class III-fold pyridoxal phosphate-dependent enzyme [Bacteriovoracaceae bacterium]
MKLGVDTPEIKTKIDELFSAILAEQSQVTGLKGPNPEKKHLVEEYLADYAKNKGRGFFFNYLSSGKGHGPFTEQIDESVKYDLIGGIGPNILGHSHPLYIKGTLEAATTDTIMCGNLLSYHEPAELTKTLLNSVSQSRLKHFWFAGSGSFANDNALKIIWQKTSPKNKIIAFEKAFAGRSIATQEITFNPAYRQGMPQHLNIEHVPHFNHFEKEKSLEETMKHLNNIWEKDKDNVCALMIELVQGEAGFNYGTKEYYQSIFKWAKEKGLYIIVDEVQTFARTRELFAFQMFELDEYVDVVTIGKALQACGTFYTEELNPKPGLIAGTFNGSLAALRVGNLIVNYLLNGHFYSESGRMKKIEESFISRLRYLSQNSCKGKIGYIGGIGTMISFEVGDASKATTDEFIKALYKNGIICFSAGKDPFRVRFLLPTCLTDDHIDEIFEVIETSILEVIK